MRTLLILSPHLDDAAFSISPLLLEMSANHRITVATPFAGSVKQPKGFALDCQLDKGLGPQVDYMKLRRSEDAQWAEKICAEVIHGDLKEAPHRGYESAADLFSGIHSADSIGPELQAWLSAIAESLSPNLILLPLGIGGHVDHLWLRQVTEATSPDLASLVYYCDQPYCAKIGLTPTDPALAETRGLEDLKLTPDPPALRGALEATEAYKSQIPFQFGTFEKMRSLLVQTWSEALYLFSTQSVRRQFQQTIQPAFH